MISKNTASRFNQASTQREKLQSLALLLNTSNKSNNVREFKYLSVKPNDV